MQIHRKLATEPRKESGPMNSITRRQRGRAGRRLLPLLLVPLVAGVAACDGLLDVTNPGSVQESDLSNPALAQTLVNSALGQFECAYTSYVVSTGVLAGEYVNASSWLDINGWGWRGLELNTITGTCPIAVRHIVWNTPQPTRKSAAATPYQSSASAATVRYSIATAAPLSSIGMIQCGQSKAAPGASSRATPGV